MKEREARIALLCIILMVLGLILTSQSIAEIDPATITGMWLFDEGSGKVAKDSSGNGLDADLIDGPKWVDGVFGKALEFDGASSYVEIPAHENPSVAITVSIWAKSNTETWNQHGWVFEKRDAYMMHNVQGNTTTNWIICNGACWNQPFTWETGQVGPDDITEWHMYTGTFDSKTGDWKLYIDGKEESTLDLNKSPLVVENGPIFIGNDTWCAGRFGDGVVDEAIIFDVALSADDIEALANKGIEGASAVSSVDKLTTTWADIKTQD